MDEIKFDLLDDGSYCAYRGQFISLEETVCAIAATKEAAEEELLILEVLEEEIANVPEEIGEALDVSDIEM